MALYSGKTPVGSGGVPNPVTLSDGEMIRFDDTISRMEGSGDINTDSEVDFGSKDLRCKSVITEAASIDIGSAITISERGGYLQTHVDTTDRDFISVDYEVNDAGSQKPSYDARATKEIHVVTQGVDTTTMLDVTSYQITPSPDADISKVYLKFANSVTNFRMQIVSDVTGLPIKYFPTENDWRQNTGVSVAAGEYAVEFISPFAEIGIMPITVNLEADTQIDLLGDGVNPYRAIDRQVITQHTMLDTTSSVTELSDVTDAGSGEIISTVERDKLDGIEEGAQKNDVDQIKAVLTTNKTLDGTEQLIDFDASSEAQGISMVSNGVFEVSRDGYYSGSLHTYLVNSGFPSVIVWVECRASAVDPWELCGDHMIKSQAFTDSSASFPFNSNFNFTAGYQYKIMIKKLTGTSAMTKQTSVVSGGTLTQYPASLSVFRVGNKIL